MITSIKITKGDSIIIHIIPAAFGPIMDRSEGVARGFILYKQKPVGRVLIQYRDKR